MPIVSSVVIGRALAERRPRADPSGAAAAAVVVGVVACAQIAVFGSTLRRYLVGTDGPILPWVRTQGAWHPPVPATALDVVAAVALLGLAVHMAAGRPAPPPTRHGRRRRPQSRRALEPVIE
jgi:hypothetical protein